MSSRISARIGFLLRRVLPAAVCALLLGACAGPTTQTEVTWTAPNAASQPLHRVVTLFVGRSPALRRTAETDLARELARRGVWATPAWQVLAPVDLQNREEAKARLRAMGFDGIVTMRFVSREQKLTYVPPTFDGFWAWGEPYFFWPGYYEGPIATYSPGYAETTTIVRMETDAYSLRNGQLLWSTLSKTIDPINARQLVGQVAEHVASRMTAGGFAG